MTPPVGSCPSFDCFRGCATTWPRLTAPRHAATAGAADYQLGLEYDVTVLVARLVEFLQQQLGGRTAQLLAGPTNGGEGHDGGSGRFDIVIAGDRDVLGHSHAA